MLLHSVRWTIVSSRTVQGTITSSPWAREPIFQIFLHFCQQTIKQMNSHPQTWRYLFWVSHYQLWIKISRIKTMYKMRSSRLIILASRLWVLSRLKSTSQPAKTWMANSSSGTKKTLTTIATPSTSNRTGTAAYSKRISCLAKEALEKYSRFSMSSTRDSML